MNTRFLVALILAVSTMPAAGQSVPVKFSYVCDNVRVKAIRGYWTANLTPEKMAQIERILELGSSEKIGAALVGEAMAGRVSVRQLGASSLAGFDAVDNSAVCGESDRQVAKRLRLLVPILMLQLADQISHQKGSNQ